MTPITIYIEDEDYDRVIVALSRLAMVAEGDGEDEEPEPETATEEKATQAILSWVEQVVRNHDWDEHQAGHVFVPPGLSAPRPWVQPDSTNPYKVGDFVTHNGQVWKAVEGDGAGNNVWEPGVFGWEVV